MSVIIASELHAEISQQRRNLLLCCLLLITVKLLQPNLNTDTLYLFNQQLAIQHPAASIYIAWLCFIYCSYRFIASIHPVIWQPLYLSWLNYLHKYCFEYLKIAPYADQIKPEQQSKFGNDYLSQMLLRSLVDAIKQTEDTSLSAELCKEKLRTGQFDTQHSRGLIKRITIASIVFIINSKAVADYIAPLIITFATIIFSFIMP